MSPHRRYYPPTVSIVPTQGLSLNIHNLISHIDPITTITATQLVRGQMYTLTYISFHVWEISL